MKENSPKLGHLITHEVSKDAIHFAVAPVEATENLSPGARVYFHIQGNTEKVRLCRGENKPVGIIDPFLAKGVKAGEYCWMMLMPNTITSLRHEWTHPAYDQDEKGIAEFWLREFVDNLGEYESVSFEEVMDQLKETGGVFLGTDINYGALHEEEVKKLKRYFKIYTGQDLPDEPNFHCAC